MQIVYGYCSDDKTNFLDRFVEQGEFVAVKTLGVVNREYVVFAALVPCNDRLRFPFSWGDAHFVAVQKQAQSIDRLTFPTSNNASKKRYRKIKNAIITSQNWRQHINRNRGLKYVSSFLEFKSQEFEHALCLAT